MKITVKKSAFFQPVFNFRRVLLALLIVLAVFGLYFIYLCLTLQLGAFSSIRHRTKFTKEIHLTLPQTPLVSFQTQYAIIQVNQSLFVKHLAANTADDEVPHSPVTVLISSVEESSAAVFDLNQHLELSKSNAIYFAPSLDSIIDSGQVTVIDKSSGQPASRLLKQKSEFICGSLCGSSYNEYLFPDGRLVFRYLSEIY
ncbi:MAG: hypothetical protein WC686_03735 [Candidatus Shapirobacteria bacterium]|jgi:hypothetical protein